MSRRQQTSMKDFVMSNDLISNKRKDPSTLNPKQYLGDETSFGPSNSGERNTSYPKKVKTNADFKSFRMGVFKDGKDYWDQRMSNSNQRPSDASIYSALLKDGTKMATACCPQIFKGITFYFNSGCFTDIPTYHLTKLVSLHGGRVLPFFSHAATHVLCQNLTVTKEKELRKRFGQGQQPKYLRPDFVVDSLKAGQLKPELDYLVLKTNDKRTPLVVSEKVLDHCCRDSNSRPDAADHGTSTGVAEADVKELQEPQGCGSLFAVELCTDCDIVQSEFTHSPVGPSLTEALPTDCGNLDDSGSEQLLFSDSSNDDTL